MKKCLVSLLLVSASILLADLKIDYAVHIEKNGQERTLRRVALMGVVDQVNSVVENAPTSLSETDLSSAVDTIDLDNASDPEGNTLADTVISAANNTPSVVTNTIENVVSQSAVPFSNFAQNDVEIVGSTVSNPMAVVGDASALVGNPEGLLNNPSALLVNPNSVVQSVDDLVVGIDVLKQAENGVDLVFTVAQKQLDGSLVPIAQLPIVAQFDKEEIIQAPVDNVNGLESLAISLVATPVSAVN